MHVLISSPQALLLQQTLQSLNNLISNFLGTTVSTKILSPQSIIKDLLDCLLDEISLRTSAKRVSEEHGYGEDGSDGVCDSLTCDIGGGTYLSALSFGSRVKEHTVNSVCQLGVCKANKAELTAHRYR